MIMQEATARTVRELSTAFDREIQSVTEHEQPVILSDPILCYYVNATKRIQVVRLSHLKEGEWEHILFPAQNFMFEAPPEAMLEVYKSPALSVAPPEYILCRTLQVQSDN
jgi:Domain of unknown function (DUF1830)